MLDRYLSTSCTLTPTFEFTKFSLTSKNPNLRTLLSVFARTEEQVYDLLSIKTFACLQHKMQAHQKSADACRNMYQTVSMSS